MAEKKSYSKSSCTSKIAACFLIIVNLVTITCCSLLVALSLWAKTSPTTLSAAIQALGGNTLTAILPPSSVSVQSAVGIVAVATFICCVAFMGLYGAVCRSQFLLFMYSTQVLLLLLLECALMFYFTSNLIEKGVQVEDGQWAHYTRLVFQCCDFNSSQYRDAAVPPWSCCGTGFYPNNCTVPDSFPKDCKPTIRSWLDRYGTAVYTLLAVLHLTLSLCSLLRRSRSSSRSHS